VFTLEVRRKVWVAPFGLRDLYQRPYLLAHLSSRGWDCASGRRRTAAGSNFPWILDMRLRTILSRRHVAVHCSARCWLPPKRMSREPLCGVVVGRSRPGRGATRVKFELFVVEARTLKV